MQPEAIGEALAEAAAEVVLPAGYNAGLTCTGYMPDSVSPPHLFLADFSGVFDLVMGRKQDELSMTFRVLFGRADDRSAQKLMFALLAGAGPASLKQAFEAARGAPGEYALNGLADDFQVQRFDGMRWYEHAGVQYVGTEIKIRVIGEGDN